MENNNYILQTKKKIVDAFEKNDINRFQALQFKLLVEIKIEITRMADIIAKEIESKKT